MAKNFTLTERASGVLLHPTSLPGPHGIGDLGSDAFQFVDFLSSSKQTWWQMFPLGPAGFGGSPYQPTSAFAGNPLLINLNFLVRDGLLKKSDIQGKVPAPPAKINFDRVQAFKTATFQKAFWNFETNKKWQTPFREFLEKNKWWLEDTSLYCVLKEMYKGRSWVRWSPDFRDRIPSEMVRAKTQLATAMRYHQFLQFLFFKQWNALRVYAHEKGVGFIGDIPIFVAHDSADVWTHRDLFFLKPDGQPQYVAGTPPDYFSRSGQLWGNPLYRWDVMKKNKYRWWMRRFQSLYQMVDAIRLDHFIGFERYWCIPANDKTATGGRWIPGPSDDFFNSLKKSLGPMEIIAEDLGAITEEVKALRDRFKFPGMKILQFAFGDLSSANTFLPHNFMRNAVVYTGTHDNDTTVGWYRDAGGRSSTRTKRQIEIEKRNALGYMHTDGRQIHWDMIRTAFASVANIAIIPAQDILGLGTSARMNVPGTSKGNWTWRLKPGQLTKAHSERLAQLARLYGR